MDNFKRRRLLINPRVQGALLKRTCFYWAFGCASILAMMAVWKLFCDPMTSLSSAIQQSWTQCAPIFVFSLLLLPVVLYDTLRTSNRVAGPLYRLRMEMIKLRESNGEANQPLRFRDGDFWGEIANEYNRVLNKVRSQDERLRDYFDKAPELVPEAISSEA